MRLQISVILIIFSFANTSFAAPIPPPKHVFIFMADTLRRDHVGAYADADPNATPNINKLCEGGTLFNQAVTTCPISAPAYTSLFTSKWPFQHGLINNGQSYPKEKQSFTQILENSGFYTSAFVANTFCGKRYGFDSIFKEIHSTDEVGTVAFKLTEKALPWLENWKPEEKPLIMFLAYMDPHTPYQAPGIMPEHKLLLDGETIKSTVNFALSPKQPLEFDLPPGEHQLSLNSSEGNSGTFTGQFYFQRGLVPGKVTAELRDGKGQVVERIMDRLFRAEHAQLPITVHLNNMGTAPQHLVGEIKSKLTEHSLDEAKRLYKECIAHMDKEIGKILDVLRAKGVYDDSLIIFLSDHGEGMGDHGLRGHVQNLYDSLVHVPLIMRYPPLTTYPVVDAQVSIVDIAPTILQSLGMGESSWNQGYSMLSLLKGEEDLGRNWTLAETHRPQAKENKSMLRTVNEKLIINYTTKDVEHYRLQEDKAELINLKNNSHTTLIEEFKNVTSVSDIFTPLIEDIKKQPITPEQREELEALGYLY